MKYSPLQDYLRELPTSEKEVTLRFAEIEKIIGAKLPESAFTYREWWANQKGGSRAPHWQAAGFIVDTVDMKRNLAYFRRDKVVPRAKKKPQTKQRKQGTKNKPIDAKLLLDAGFKRYGRWEFEGEHIHLVGDIPTDPGVYAHVVDGKVYYVGVATMGLKKRLYFYAKPGSTQRTSIRVNGLIKEELKAGRTVELIAAFPEPTSWNGLPVDTVTGLESGLVKKFSPPWNKRGVAG